MDLSGKQFDRWSVLHFHDRSGVDRKPRWWCRCQCGSERAVFQGSLVLHTSRSCGCLRREVSGSRTRTHGRSGTKIYMVWSDMLKRCNNPGHPSYKHYGGRGISVCERWRDIENFVSDMGDPEEKRELDRIDNDGPYSPDNCRWATRSEQANNSRRNKWVSYQGETLTVTQWAERLNIEFHVLRWRLKHNWPIERALTEPLHIEDSHRTTR